MVFHIYNLNMYLCFSVYQVFMFCLLVIHRWHVSTKGDKSKTYNFPFFKKDNWYIKNTDNIT